MINLPDSTKKLSNELGAADIGAAQGSGRTSPGGTNTNFKASNNEAKKAAETYIGRVLTDIEWDQLVSATFAEASANQTERAYVMAAILNRARTGNGGKTITGVLYAKNQFQSVTGTKADGYKPSVNFVNGPNSQAATNIYGAATNILSTVPKNIINFTAANLKAYGPGTNPNYIKILKDRGGIQIGQTIFSA
jgi:hypothetical protein